MRHGTLFTVRVQTRDGKKCGVTLMIDHKKTDLREADLRNLALQLRIPRNKLGAVLDNWAPEALVEHLSQYSSDELKPPSITKRF